MRDEYCSYYTDSEEITTYMVRRLNVKKGDLILEPSAGEGIFIDALLNRSHDIRIDALDINRDAIKVLEEKYRDNPNVCIRMTDTLLDDKLDAYGLSELWLKQTDTLIDEQLDYFNLIGGHYSKVIGNPPYGAWQDYEKRDALKKKYSGHYVKETYSLFLLRCISVLKTKGRLSFIIPDTFLFLNMHARLREVLLTTSKIEEILIFPSNFFPGVSFGYSSLSIITLERADKQSALNNSVRILKGFQNPSEFRYAFEKRLPTSLQEYKLKQKDIFEIDNHRFLISDKNSTGMIGGEKIKLGDVADVVTGFYCGDNRRFIRAANSDVKGAKSYRVVDPEKVFLDKSLYGIKETDEGYIPFIKGSPKRRYFRSGYDWYIRWDRTTIETYNGNRKSRFQNSSFYFRKGIAIPMVKANQIKATIMEDDVFDQSIVGIFPKEKEKLYYILALMNSEIVNEIIHIINPTANNSANYVKLIPYREPVKKTLNTITELVSDIIENEKQEQYEQSDALMHQVNEMIRRVYSDKK